MSEEVSDMMGRSKHGAHSQDTCKCPHCEKNLSLNNNFCQGCGWTPGEAERVNKDFGISEDD